MALLGISSASNQSNYRLTDMAITAQQVITGNWIKVSDGDCTMQSEASGILFDIAVSPTEPVQGSLFVSLDQPTTFAYKTAVWVRLNAKGGISMQCIINIIKE